MSNGRSLPQSWPGLSAAARLRLVLPEIEAWAREYGSHDVIVADLADRGLVVSKALLRKELLKYRRKMAATLSTASLSRPAAPPPYASQCEAGENPDPAELARQQRLEALAAELKRNASTSKLGVVLNPEYRRLTAEKYMRKHEEPRLGRKQREEEARAKGLSPDPD